MKDLDQDSPSPFSKFGIFLSYHILTTHHSFFLFFFFIGGGETYAWQQICCEDTRQVCFLIEHF